MNWEAIAAGAEVLGSLAVLATLVYLAVQTRHARIANESSNQWQRANASRELAMLWAMNPESVDLLAEFGHLETDPGTDVRENPRYFRYWKINQSILETLHAIYITAHTEEEKALIVERIKSTMIISGFRATWPRLKEIHLFRQEFVEIVEQSIVDRHDA